LNNKPDASDAELAAGNTGVLLCVFFIQEDTI